MEFSEFDSTKKDIRHRMNRALEVLQDEFAGLRTGRASTALLEPVTVHAYGTDMPMNQIGTISAPEPRLLTIQVWDAGLIQAVEKAICYRNKIGKGSLKSRLKKLIDLRSEEGYLSELSSSSDGLSWYLHEFHCSIRLIAEKYPIVCDQELQLIRQTFPDCEVERVQWRLETVHSCGFHITPCKSNV